MFNPSPQSTAEAVYATLNLMEKKAMAFPKAPQLMPNQTASELDEKEIIHETVQKMLRQLMIIEVSQSKSGVAHFDVPAGGGHALQKKDLYTSFILAAKKAYDLILMANSSSGILDIGLVSNLKVPEYPGADRLNQSLAITNSPVNSWAYRKTFTPGKK